VSECVLEGCESVCEREGYECVSQSESEEYMREGACV
jgi:hypothetical protein